MNRKIAINAICGAVMGSIATKIYLSGQPWLAAAVLVFFFLSLLNSVID
jgi:hypothetical protein